MNEHILKHRQQIQQNISGSYNSLEKSKDGDLEKGGPGSGRKGHKTYKDYKASGGRKKLQNAIMDGDVEDDNNTYSVEEMQSKIDRLNQKRADSTDLKSGDLASISSTGERVKIISKVSSTMFVVRGRDGRERNVGLNSLTPIQKSEDSFDSNNTAKDRQETIKANISALFEKAGPVGGPPTGKEHLTPKVITDRNGNRKTVYVNTTRDTPGQKSGEKKMTNEKFAGMMQIVKEEYEKGNMTEEEYKSIINIMAKKDPSNQKEEKPVTESSGRVGHTITSKDGTKGTIIHSDETGHIVEYQQDGQESHAHISHEQFEQGKEKGHFTHETKTGDEHPFEDVDGDGKTGENTSEVDEGELESLVSQRVKNPESTSIHDKLNDLITKLAIESGMPKEEAESTPWMEDEGISEGSQKEIVSYIKQMLKDIKNSFGKSYQLDIIGNGISFEERQANKISQFYK